MNFVTIEYAVFLLLVFIISRTIGKKTVPVLFLLASLTFYGMWNWKFLGLLGSVITVTYLGGLVLEKWRFKIVLGVFVLTDLSFLFYFKYYGFFLENIKGFGSFLGINVPLIIPNVILPVGISFFTFQAIGYLFDIYRGNIQAEKSPFWVALFISFFPQLVAGPIERTNHLMPQLKKFYHNIITRADLQTGFFMILHGVFIKLVIADNLGNFVNDVYGSIADQSSVNALLACYFFSIQIYCDFYGYTLIALGTSRLFGIELINNFDYPYLSCNIRDFWRRWHISLSSWVRDYVYISLGGNRVSRPRQFFNLTVTMLVMGLWHGASNTFLVWGALHGLMLAIHRMFAFATSHIKSVIPHHIGRIIATFFTFHCVTFAWIFFRAPDFKTAGLMFQKILEIITSPGQIFAQPQNFASYYLEYYLFIAGIFIIIEIMDKLLMLKDKFKKAPVYVQAGIIFIILLLTYLGPENDVQFIYFQF